MFLCIEGKGLAFSRCCVVLFFHPSIQFTFLGMMVGSQIKQKPLEIIEVKQIQQRKKDGCGTFDLLLFIVDKIRL